MTEQTASIQDVIVRPTRARPRRVKSPETIAFEKRVTRIVSKFLVEAMTPTIQEIGVMFAEAEKKNRELEQRHRELAKTITNEVFRFAGTWRQDKTFPRGSVVVHSGSLWFANETNDVRPGTSGDWQLVVKKGSFDDDKPRRSP